MTRLRASLIGSLTMAAVSTAGDFIWATWISRPQPIHGLAHGTLLFLCLGLILGALTHKPGWGAFGGAAIGGFAAAGFYVLAPLVGGSIMFALWVLIWLALGWLNGQLNNQSAGQWVARGLVGAIGSGVAFYLISGIWFPFDPRGWDYLVHFGAWTLAYLPGLAALLMTSPATSMTSGAST